MQLLTRNSISFLLGMTKNLHLIISLEKLNKHFLITSTNTYDNHKIQIDFTVTTLYRYVSKFPQVYNNVQEMTSHSAFKKIWLAKGIKLLQYT